MTLFYHPLEASTIQSHLQSLACPTPFELHVYATIDSTHQWLKNASPTTHPLVCCAEAQTAGRGRFENQWHSPFGENIYCSIRFTNIPPQSGLSLVVGLAVISALQSYGLTIPLQIKWPNDIVVQHQKLAGILVDTHHQALLIGIGLNVHTTALDPTWCSLYSLTQTPYDRNQLLAHLLHTLSLTLTHFQQHGFTAFMSQWREVDALYGHRITLTQSHHQLEGVAQGIDASGQLLLLDDHGALHHLISGQTKRVRAFS